MKNKRSSNHSHYSKTSIIKVTKTEEEIKAEKELFHAVEQSLSNLVSDPLSFSMYKFVINFFKQSIKDLTEEKADDVKAIRKCVVCLETEEPDMLFVPCHHCQTCSKCAALIMKNKDKKCPTCRSTIFAAKKIFL